MKCLQNFRLKTSKARITCGDWELVLHYRTHVRAEWSCLYLGMRVLTFTAPHMRRTEISTVIIRFNAMMIFTETKTECESKNITLEPKLCCCLWGKMLKGKKYHFLKGWKLNSIITHFSLVVSYVPPGAMFKNPTSCPQSIFHIILTTVIISLYKINWLFSLWRRRHLLYGMD